MFVKAEQFLLGSSVSKKVFDICNKGLHSHKKRKDNMETRAVLLIFFLELEISGVAVRRIHQNIKK